MKPTAQILKYQEKDPRTPGELTEMLETLFADLTNRDITPAEFDKIYKDVRDRGKSLGVDTHNAGTAGVAKRN